jgi:hypothetical protein
LAATAV